MDLTLNDGPELNDTMIFNQVTSGKIQEPSELMRRCGWVLYTIIVYLNTFVAFGVMIGSSVYYFMEVRGAELDENTEEEKKHGYDIREDIIIVFFLGFSQMLVFWHGKKARSSLDSGDQERFKNFLKCYFYLFVILWVLFVMFCIINRDFFSLFETHILEIEHYIVFGSFGIILLLKIMDNRARKLEEHFVKYEAMVKYSRSMNPVPGDESMM